MGHMWSFLTFIGLVGLATLCGAQQIPPKLKVEGVPEISEELVRRMAQYQNVRSATFAAWHPTKREMLIATRFAETTQAHHVASPGGARRQMTFFDERVTPHGIDPVRGEFFVFSMDVGGSEFYQLYRFDLETGKKPGVLDG